MGGENVSPLDDDDDDDDVQTSTEIFMWFVF